VFYVIRLSICDFFFFEYDPPRSYGRNLRRQHREATAAGIVPGTTAMYMQRSMSGAAGNSLYTTIKNMRGAAGIGLGTTIKYLRRTTSGAAGNGLSPRTTA
jgi:hypothetical protein